MIFLRLTINEIKKLKSSYLAVFCILLTAVIPIVGFLSPMGILSESSNGVIILSPVKAGALLGSVVFALFTIYELDRMYRYNSISIIETCTDMISFYLSKTFSIIFAGAVSSILSYILYIPYSMIRLSNLFDPGLYLASYLTIMFPAILFSIMISAGVYMIVKRMDISYLIYGAIAYMSMNTNNNYLAAWIQTSVPAYSDCFGNSLALRTVLWNRLLWLAVSSAVLTLGIMCTRKYGRNILYSSAVNSRKVYIPFLAVLFILGAYTAYEYEPYFDDTPDIKFEMVSNKDSKTSSLKMVFGTSDNNETIKQVNLNADIVLNTKNASLNSRAVFNLENTKEIPQDIILRINPGYSIKSIKLDGKEVPYDILDGTEMNQKKIRTAIPADRQVTMEVVYSGNVQVNRLFQSTLGNTVISDDYISLGGSSLLPVLDVDAKGCKVGGSITVPSSLTVITTGDTTKKVSEDPSQNTCTWNFSCAGSSIQLIAGAYKDEKFKAGGIDVEFYYNLRHEGVVRSLEAGKVIKEAIDYFTDAYGPLNYANIPLKIVDNTINLMGGNAVGNICNIGEGIFMEKSFTNEAYSGTNGVEVLVHEICHEWWGIGTIIPISSYSPWSSEGLTVYSTYKFLQHKYGPGYSQKTCVDSWESTLDGLKRNFYYRHPEYMDIIPSGYLFNVLGTQNGPVMYAEMPLQILKGEQLLGENKFKSALSKLYKRYKSRLTYEDFLDVCGLTKEMISVE